MMRALVDIIAGPGHHSPLSRLWPAYALWGAVQGAMAALMLYVDQRELFDPMPEILYGRASEVLTASEWALIVLGLSAAVVVGSWKALIPWVVACASFAFLVLYWSLAIYSLTAELWFFILFFSITWGAVPSAAAATAAALSLERWSQ